MKLSTIKKPSYMFVFSNEQDAKQFYNFASEQLHSTIVQHPYSGDGSITRNLLRVLVTASGSLFFDMALREILTQKAKELGGDYLQRI